MLILTQRCGFVKRFSRFPPGNSPIFPSGKTRRTWRFAPAGGVALLSPPPAPSHAPTMVKTVSAPAWEGETILYISFQGGDKPPFVSPRKGKGPLATPLRGGAPVSAPASVGPGRCPPGTRTPLAPPVRARSSLAYYKKGFQRGIKSPFEKLYIILEIRNPLPAPSRLPPQKSYMRGRGQGVGRVTARDRKIPLGSARRNFVSSPSPLHKDPFRHRSAMTPS